MFGDGGAVVILFLFFKFHFFFSAVDGRAQAVCAVSEPVRGTVSEPVPTRADGFQHHGQRLLGQADLKRVFFRLCDVNAEGFKAGKVRFLLRT